MFFIIIEFNHNSCCNIVASHDCTTSHMFLDCSYWTEPSCQSVAWIRSCLRNRYTHIPFWSLQHPLACWMLCRNHLCMLGCSAWFGCGHLLCHSWSSLSYASQRLDWMLLVDDLLALMLPLFCLHGSEPSRGAAHRCNLSGSPAMEYGVYGCLCHLLLLVNGV